jgi:hypothetical protein
MPLNQNPSSLRAVLIAELSPLLGLTLTIARRAVDMRMFHFGPVRLVDGGSVGDFAIHVQCPWRIEGPEGIVTGRSDLWEPADADVPFDEKWHYDKSPNLQDLRLDGLLIQSVKPFVVEKVDADEFGGVAICLSQGYVLRLFPAGTRGEDWRFFQPTRDAPHLVITGGVIETDKTT